MVIYVATDAAGLKSPAAGLQTYQNITRGPWALILCLRPTLAICQSSTHTSFLPRGVKIELIFASRFPKYRPIFKIAIFGHETWPLAKVPEDCTYTLFLPQGVEIELVLAAWAAVSEIQAISQNCHIWTWNLESGQSARSCTCTLFSTPRGWNEAYFCSMDSGFRDTGNFSKLSYLGMKLGKWPKFQKLHIYNLKWSWVPKFHSILLYDRSFSR